MIAIRQATLDDAKRLLEIYDYYVKNTAITFEYDTPSLAEFQSRMERTMKRYPYLVAMDGQRVEETMLLNSNEIKEIMMPGMNDGTGKAVCDGIVESLSTGTCHICHMYWI